MRKLLWILALVPMLALAQPSQNELRQMARTEATRQGVDPDELEARLQARGVNTSSLTMADASRVQPIVEEEIAAMKAELESQTTPVAGNATSAALNSNLKVAEPVATNQRVEVEAAVKSEAKVALSDSSDANMVFGKHIFTNGSLNLYEVSKDYIPNDSYILGPGDVVTVSIFGKSQADLQFTIKPDGFIEPANLPKIYLKGISLGQAREVVERRLRNFYQFDKGQFALTLTTARTLTIQITGAVAQPGTYTLSAYNTAFNALIAAGGPSKLGTVRNIQVINGGRVKELDVYEYLFNPKKQKDYYLQNNDILYVPFIGDLVEVKGSVKQVGVFEMKDKETFEDLLIFTGGYLSDAVQDEIQLVRKNAEGSFVKEYSGAELSKLTFEDGDKVIIATQTSDKKDYVEVSGWVDYPGIYGIRDYSTIAKVLEKVGLREETRLDVAYLTRLRADGTTELIPFSPEAIMRGEGDLSLQSEDKIQVLDKRNYVDRATVKITGEVRNPGSYTIDENVTIPALIDLSNGLTRTAKRDAAYVFRTYPNGETEVLPVSLDDAAFEFVDRDELRILSEKTFYDGAVLSVSGEVKMPLEMPYDFDITLAEVVELAGGLTFAGDSSQLVVYRMPFSGATIGELEEITLNLATDGDFVFQPFDALIVRRKFGFEFQDYVELKGEVVFPGRYAIRKGETVRDIIRKAGGLTATAFPEAALFEREGKGEVSISIEKILKNKGSYDNIELLPGDILTVPAKDYTVEIRMANTEAENFGLFSDRFEGESMHVAYIAGKKAKWYVKNLAGGYGENAKRTNTTVIYANGVARDYKFWKGHAKVKPGAMIVVAAKPEKPEGKEREKIDWVQFSQNLIAQATSVLTVWTLATKL